MKSPRAGYRVLLVLAPLVAVITVLAAVDGMWLSVLIGIAAMTSGAAGFWHARRRGIRWDWPSTWRELRQQESGRAEDRSSR